MIEQAARQRAFDIHVEVLQDAADPTTGDVTEYVKANMDISFPNCPSKGVYTVTLDPVTNHISMSCSMEEHELPGETEDPGTE